jgi:hypothetical protein
MPVGTPCASAWLALSMFGTWLHEIHVLVLTGFGMSFGTVKALGEQGNLARCLQVDMELRSCVPLSAHDICH